VEIAQSFLGDIASLVMFALLIAGTMKVFQMASDMREIKDVLSDIRRNTQRVSAPAASQAAGPASPMTPEELVRAVHAQKFSDDEFPVLDRVVLPPQS
jgi:hypothetical protein